jgi:EmrB/QacA subfamily drug resistance transporter
VARGLQGLGGAIISPIALSIVGSSFEPGAERNRAVGIFGSLTGLGGAVGVLLGGILTTDFGWEWVLFVNVPIGLITAALTPRLVPRDEAAAEGGFDILGAAAVTASLVALVYGVVKAPSEGWTSGTTLGFFAASVILLAAFIVIELRSTSPLVDLRIFRIRNLTIADLTGMLTAGGMFAMFFFLSLYMQDVLRYDALQTGIRYLPLALSIVVAAGVTSQLVTRFGYKYIMTIGLTVGAVGLYLLSHIRATGSFEHDVLVPMVIVAFGLGMTFVPLQISSVTGVPPAEIGLASGLVNAFLQVGGAVGLAVLTTISTTEFNGVMVASHGNPQAIPGALVSGFQHAFLAGSILLLAGAVVVLVLLPQGGHDGDEQATLAAAG